MRSIIFLMHISLDGLVAGPNGEMDWIAYSNALEKHVHTLHDTTDTAIYGRVTYQMMQGYWPSVLSNPDSAEGEKNHARWYANATKIVISRTLTQEQDSKTIVIHDNIAEEITKLKQQPGKNMWLIGSPSTAQTFMRLGLIDEYWITVSPVVLGKGKPLFANLDDTLKLKLLETKPLEGGVVVLRYEPARG